MAKKHFKLIKIWTPGYKELSPAQIEYVFNGARVMVNLKVITSCEQCPLYRRKKQ